MSGIRALIFSILSLAAFGLCILSMGCAKGGAADGESHSPTLESTASDPRILDDANEELANDHPEFIRSSDIGECLDLEAISKHVRSKGVSERFDYINVLGLDDQSLDPFAKYHYLFGQLKRRTKPRLRSVMHQKDCTSVTFNDSDTDEQQSTYPISAFSRTTLMLGDNFGLSNLKDGMIIRFVARGKVELVSVRTRELAKHANWPCRNTAKYKYTAELTEKWVLKWKTGTTPEPEPFTDELSAFALQLLEKGEPLCTTTSVGMSAQK